MNETHPEWNGLTLFMCELMFLSRPNVLTHYYLSEQCLSWENGECPSVYLKELTSVLFVLLPSFSFFQTCQFLSFAFLRSKENLIIGECLCPNKAILH